MTMPKVNHTDHRAGCIFCQIVAKQVPAYIIDEDDAVLVFLALGNYPLIVPKEHIPDIYAMGDDIGARVMAKTIRIAQAVKRALRCDGIYLTQANEPAAGQDVFHFHLHVYPCWEDKELEAIVRFARSVTDRANTTDEARVSMMRQIKAGLASL